VGNRFNRTSRLETAFAHYPAAARVRYNEIACQTVGGAFEMVVRLENLPLQAPPLRTDERGVVRVGDTRVTLESVLSAFQNGCGPEEIVLKYPSLRLADVYAVIAHALAHPEAVKAYLKSRDSASEAARADAERRFPPDGVRARLLSRRSARE
jgi:uncharacterized protein (DUF433 family)